MRNNCLFVQSKFYYHLCASVECNKYRVKTLCCESFTCQRTTLCDATCEASRWYVMLRCASEARKKVAIKTCILMVPSVAQDGSYCYLLACFARTAKHHVGFYCVMLRTHHVPSTVGSKVKLSIAFLLYLQTNILVGRFLRACATRFCKLSLVLCNRR